MASAMRKQAVATQGAPAKTSFRAAAALALASVVVVLGAAELAVRDPFLEERHAETHRHAPDELGARGLGVDDATRREDSGHPRHPDLAGVRVDAHLDELSAEGPKAVKKKYRALAV